MDLDQTNSLPHGIVRVAFVRRLSCYRYVIIELRLALTQVQQTRTQA